MSFRLRLAVWYGALFACVLLLVTMLTYALHVRGHYDDLDRALITSAEHATAAVSIVNRAHLASESAAMQIVLRRYDRQGIAADDVPAAAFPAIDPTAVLAAPSGPAFDVLANLVPPLMSVPNPGDGAFGLLSSSNQRWRVYVLPLRAPSAETGYIAALAPLGQLDHAIASFRTALLLLGLSGLALAMLGGWVLAAQALRPVDRMIQTARTIAAARDVSHRIPVPPTHDELRRLADTFNAMLASLEEANRTQQRFVADASHELRTPLTVIQGNLELIRCQPDMPATARDEALAEVEREANRLSRLVADLLALARADAGLQLQQHPVDLDALVLESFHSARRLARGQQLRLDPFEPLQVCGNADRLRQLLLILLDNALKYTPDTGQVTLGLQRCADQAAIIVSDTGIGISDNDLPHVFERFYRADPARSRDPAGTGLGLPIAHWIVAQHGGSITLDSRPGCGTTIAIRLPLLA